MKNKEEKFREIVADNEERIKRICSYYNPNKEDQKDMYQEILVNIWKSLDSFRGEAALSTWIYRIAVNTSLGFTGKVFREMKIMVNSGTENLSSLIDDEALASKLNKEDQLNKMHLELNQLSVIDKSIISLVLEDLSMREIADVIGLTEPNVKVKIHRIKDLLRTKLSGGKHENN